MQAPNESVDLPRVGQRGLIEDVDSAMVGLLRVSRGPGFHEEALEGGNLHAGVGEFLRGPGCRGEAANLPALGLEFLANDAQGERLSRSGGALKALDSVGGTEYLAGGLALVSGSLVVERVEVSLGDPVGGYEYRDGRSAGDHESDVLAFGLQDLGGGPGSVIAVFGVDGRDEFAGIFTRRESRFDVLERDAAFAADECVADEVGFEIHCLVFEDVISGVSQGGFGCPDGVGRCRVHGRWLAGGQVRRRGRGPPGCRTSRSAPGAWPVPCPRSSRVSVRGWRAQLAGAPRLCCIRWFAGSLRPSLR